MMDRTHLPVWRRHLLRLAYAPLLVIALLPSGAPLAQTFSSNFAGFITDDRAPFDIEAAQLEIQDDRRIAVFSGDVRVTQKDTALRAGRLSIHYRDSDSDNMSRNIARLIAEGDVSISAPGQSVAGDRVSFDLDRQVMIMTGAPIELEQGDNRLSGSRLTVNLKTGTARLESDSKARIRLKVNAGGEP